MPTKFEGLFKSTLVYWKTDPFFLKFENEGIHDPNVEVSNAILADKDIYWNLLGTAIPSKTYSVGANPLPSLQGRNNDAQTWASENAQFPSDKGLWKHSDLKNLAYHFVWKLFQQVVVNQNTK